MPYKSRAQQRYFHAHEDEIGSDTVRELDDATDFKRLPEKKRNADAPPKTASQKHRKKLKHGQFTRGGYNWRDYE